MPLDSALRALEGAAGGGWTGRAQTISLLQSKIVELKRELAASLHSKLSPGSSPSREAAANGLSLASPHKPAVVALDAASRLDAQHREQVCTQFPCFTGRKVRILTQHREQIEKIERARRQEASSLQEQVEKARTDKGVTAALLLRYCCVTAALLLLYCCLTAASSLQELKALYTSSLRPYTLVA